jgi:hypothetical protein
VEADDNNNMTEGRGDILSKPQHPWNSGGGHPFTAAPSRMKTQEAPYVNKDSSLTTIFMLFFMDVIQMLLAETNKYTQYLDTLDNDRHS